MSVLAHPSPPGIQQPFPSLPDTPFPPLPFPQPPTLRFPHTSHIISCVAQVSAPLLLPVRVNKQRLGEKGAEGTGFQEAGAPKGAKQSPRGNPGRLIAKRPNSPPPNVYTPCNVTPQLLPAQGGVCSSLRWIWVWPGESLWPTQCGTSDSVAVLEV